MKFIDLKPLSIPRLKAYRKSILAKISGFEHCWCGSCGCPHAAEQAATDPNYINLRAVRERVNKELARKQTDEREAATNPAHVPTVREERRWRRK